MIILPPRASKARLAVERHGLPWLRRLRLFQDGPLQRAAPRLRVQTPWMVALLSIVPGLGHLFLEGSLAKLLAFSALAAGQLTWTYTLGHSAVGQIPTLTLFPFLCWVAADAYGSALRSQGEEIPVKRRLRISVACAAYLAGAWFVLLSFAGFQTMRGMEARFDPLLTLGHHYLLSQPPAYGQGEVVLSGRFRYYSDIWLVLATPGQSLQVMDGTAAVDGAALEGRSVERLHGKLKEGPAFSGGRLDLGPGHYAVARAYGPGPWPVEMADFATVEHRRVVMKIFPRWEFLR